MTLFAEQQSLLGKTTVYAEHYDPKLLFPIPRKDQRQEIGIRKELPFAGYDLWNAYEISWLTPGGKPVVALGEFFFPASSPNLIESKSIKLYLNSFNQTVIDSIEELERTIQHDLSQAAKAEVAVSLSPLESSTMHNISFAPGESIDDLPVAVERYEVTPSLLRADETNIVEETLHSHLLKSNCLVTGQPDWASLVVHYHGPKIDREELLKYIISYRRHQGFHEQCVEQIFCDIERHCHPEKLTVYARYTRRGGVDINPFRSNFESFPKTLRLVRQ